MKCTEYRNDPYPLTLMVGHYLQQHRVTLEDRAAVWSMLAPLGAKHAAGVFHRDHSLRVGLLACEIGTCLDEDPKAMLLAGLLHDVGKSQVPLCTLCATEAWSPLDTEDMQQHVLDGFRLLRDRFDFTAHVIARHHRYQERAYPAELPVTTWSTETVLKIERCARLLSIADVFDALHRVNSGTGGEALTSDAIRLRTLRGPETSTVEQLYTAGVLY